MTKEPNLQHEFAHVVSHSDSSPFLTGGLRSCFEYRKFGIEYATGGRYSAFVQRAVPGQERNDGWHYHELDFHLLYILSGWITFEYEDTGVTILRAGSCVLQPRGLRHRVLKYSDDLQMFEVCSPAEIDTVQVDAPFETGQ